VDGPAGIPIFLGYALSYANVGIFGIITTALTAKYCGPIYSCCSGCR